MIAVGRMVGFALAAVALAGSAVAQDTARETRMGEEGFVSPPAGLEEMDWLVGQWVGEGIKGAPAMESWLPPMGGTMVGTFVQETPDGEIMFTEHLYLMEEEGSLVLRLKHFNADLTGWEEKDHMLTFRLVAIEDCAAYFHALTLRCDDPEKPGEGLVAAVRMQSGGELLFRFDRADNSSENRGTYPLTYCDGSTRRMSECGASILERAEAKRYMYLIEAIERLNGRMEQEVELRPSLAEDVKATDKAFTAYRDAECGAVYDRNIMGSIRNLEYLACAINLTDARTHTIWKNWLTYMDSTPPVLSEPKPTM